MGQAVFTAVVLVVNLKIFCFCHSYSLWIVSLIVGSVGLNYISWVYVNDLDFGNLDHSFNRVFFSSSYLIYILFSIGLFFFDAGVTKIWRKFRLIKDETLYKRYYPPQTEKQYFLAVQNSEPNGKLMIYLDYRRKTLGYPLIARSNT